MSLKSKLQKIFLFLLVIIPFNVFAYSDYVVVGGNNIGIEVKSKGIIVVGYYNVNDNNIAKKAGFNIGDKIIKIFGIEVTNVDDMINIINKNSKKSSIEFTVLRDNFEKDINLKLYKDSKGVIKTGLYVKDHVSGIGTLTYIDPKTNIFGALGHQIVDSNSNTKIEVNSGKIFKSSITGVIKSTEKSTGEKKATYKQDVIFGNINKNTISGIFGIYYKEYEKNNLMKVAEPSEIKLGNAKILTVIDGNKIDEFDIRIININHKSSTKNILFEINDKKLIDKTNGIIKGMSGSPIIQDEKIVGAVTHAIVNDNNKGYGIFITTMLKEGENTKEE